MNYSRLDTVNQESVPSIRRILTDAEACDLFLLHVGALSPLTTFMTQSEFTSSVETMCLPSGDVMPLPITLPMKEGVTAGSVIELVTSEDSAIVQAKATLMVTEVYSILWRDEVRCIWGDRDLSSIPETVEKCIQLPHPYCKGRLQSIFDRFGRDAVFVTGVLHIQECALVPSLRGLHSSPAELKEMFRLGDYVSIAFQTRNPLHQAHVALIESAVTSVPKSPKMLVLHPTVGPTQEGDVPAKYRIKCYQEILRKLPQPAVLSIVPIAMRLAGPREALWHCVIRRNYGFQYFIVGRDHAGPSLYFTDGSSWYKPNAAVELCRKWESSLGGIRVLFGEEMAYAANHERYFPASIIAGLGDKALSMSGSALRHALSVGSSIPDWFSYPSVLDILRHVPAYEPLSRKGFCLQLTGMSGAGKSTLATALKKYLDETDVYRKCFILDGDVLRNHFKDLTFDRAARSTQTRRIGFIASLLVQSNAIVIAANIAPYAEDREYNRGLFANAQYYCIHVATPLGVCERRDPKGLYKKVRAGQLKNFTGVDDPYEAPLGSEANLTVSTLDRFDDVPIESTLRDITDFLWRNNNII